MSSLTAILSPPVMTQTFAWFTAAGNPVYFPGAPFVLAALLAALALAVFVRATARLDAPAADAAPG